MKVTFYGAAKEVTGSQHLLEVNGKRILIDCGLFQGKREESYQKNKNFLYDPATIDYLILTHAHIDHSGNIPNLVKQGFKGSIHCTSATVELAEIMLKDSAFLQEKDVEFVNKIRAKQNKPPKAQQHMRARTLAHTHAHTNVHTHIHVHTRTHAHLHHVDFQMIYFSSIGYIFDEGGRKRTIG